MLQAFHALMKTDAYLSDSRSDCMVASDIFNSFELNAYARAAVAISHTLQYDNPKSKERSLLLGLRLA